MLSWLTWRTQRADLTRTAHVLYDPIVASARQLVFYAAWGVPDTREGRFEMLALHVSVVMLRLGQAGPEGAALSRALAETFITDLDDNMREIGISDLKVPAKVKTAAAALYDRHASYGAALASATPGALDAALTAAFTTGAAATGLDCRALTSYTERLSGALAVATDADCLEGRLPLPWPAT